MPNNNIIVRETGTEAMLANVQISEAQKLVAQGAAAQILNVTSRMEAVMGEMKAMAMEIAKDPRVAQLKAYKKTMKELKNIHRESVANYNGVMKVVLADIPGRNLNEKYKALGM